MQKSFEINNTDIIDQIKIKNEFRDYIISHNIKLLDKNNELEKKLLDKKYLSSNFFSIYFILINLFFYFHSILNFKTYYLYCIPQFIFTLLYLINYLISIQYTCK